MPSRVGVLLLLGPAARIAGLLAGFRSLEGSAIDRPAQHSDRTPAGKLNEVVGPITLSPAGYRSLEASYGRWPTRSAPSSSDWSQPARGAPRRTVRGPGRWRPASARVAQPVDLDEDPGQSAPNRRCRRPARPVAGVLLRNHPAEHSIQDSELCKTAGGRETRLD